MDSSSSGERVSLNSVTKLTAPSSSDIPADLSTSIVTTGATAEQPSHSLDLARTRTYEEILGLEETEETPLGRHITAFGVVMLTLQKIIGSGIFAVSGSIYKDVGGSPLLFFVIWALAGYMSYAGISSFLELGSIVPRSGGIKVFLEYIYYKPRMMMSYLFSVYSLVFGFVITNSIIFGEYTLFALGYDDFGTQLPKYVGLGFVVLTVIINGVSPHFGVAVQNYLGVAKLAVLVLMALSGLWVLILPQTITGIPNNLHWSEFVRPKRTMTLGSITSALLKAVFSFSGWQTAHVVMNEVIDPVETMNFAAPLAIIIVSVAYFLINLSYLIVIPDTELTTLREMVGGILFEKMFGHNLGRHILTAAVAISAAGNILVCLYYISRMNQEVFRQGFLPGSRYFASNKPFNSPLRCMVFPLLFSVVFTFAKTPDNFYNWIVNLEGYPMQLFVGLCCIGVFVLRRRRADVEPTFRARTIDVIFVILFSLFTFIGPLNPWAVVPKEYQAFPNYAYTALLILILITACWWVKFRLLPRIGHYDLHKAEVVLPEGLTITEWEKERLGSGDDYEQVAQTA